MVSFPHVKALSSDGRGDRRVTDEQELE